MEARVEGAAGLRFSQKPGPLGVRDAGEEPRLRSSHMSRSTRGTIKVPLTAD